MKIYRCTHCGNIAVLLHDAGVPLVCCGQKMEALIPGSVDAAQEKHVPAVTRTGSTVEVTVGSVEHPMRVDPAGDRPGLCRPPPEPRRRPQGFLPAGRRRDPQDGLRLLQPARAVEDRAVRFRPG